MTQTEEIREEMLELANTAENYCLILNALARGTTDRAAKLAKNLGEDDLLATIEDNGDDPTGALVQILNDTALEVTEIMDDETHAPQVLVVWGTGGPHYQTTMWVNGRCDSEAWTWGFQGRSIVSAQHGDLTDLMFELV